MLIYGLGGLIAPVHRDQADRPARPQRLSGPRRQNRAHGAQRTRAATRSSSAWPPGSARPTACSQEGQAEKLAGRDVVARLPGAARARPRPRPRPRASSGCRGAQVPYRDTALEEMDLPAIFQRAPELALIDELAHTNAPGLEHAKRYEDIDDVLEAGIDVFSTVNVQHLESLNDRVAELTGVRVRETFPDTVLTAADEVVLIDLTPEALIERLRAGKIYPAERIEASLNNFFRIENLATLRELALRQTAEEVEAKARPRRADGAGRHARAGDRGGAAGGRRAGAGAGHPAAALAAPRPPRLALGAAARRGARPALRRPARLGAERPRSASSSARSRASPPCSARGCWSRRATTSPTSRPRSPPSAARTYVLIGQPPAALGARPAARVAARAADPAAAGRRRADRRRPLAARGARAVSSPDRRRRPAGGSGRILFPFLGSVLSESSLEATLRLAAAQDATLMPCLPGDRAEGALARGAAGRRVRGRAGDAGADRAAGDAGGRRGGLADRAGPDAPATRSRRLIERGALRHDRDPGGDEHLGRVLAPTTSPGRSSPRPARSWCCGPSARSPRDGHSVQARAAARDVVARARNDDEGE